MKVSSLVNTDSENRKENTPMNLIKHHISKNHIDNIVENLLGI
jgi:hypothetical protein